MKRALESKERYQGGDHHARVARRGTQAVESLACPINLVSTSPEAHPYLLCLERPDTTLRRHRDLEVHRQGPSPCSLHPA